MERFDVTAGAMLRLAGSSGEIFGFLSRHPELKLKNPEYEKAQRLNLPFRGKKEISLYRDSGRGTFLPYGFRSLLPLNVIEDSTACPKADTPESAVSLYPEQVEAVSALEKEGMGVLVAPCGSGKTQMGLALAQRIGARTLWLTHTKDLLTQSKKRAISLFGDKEGRYGEITEGKVQSIGDFITFATVQTVFKELRNLPSDTFGCIIVDECHHAICSMDSCLRFSDTLNHFSARHKYGLTATPEREDGLEFCMHALLGKTVYEIKREETEETTVPLKVVRILTSLEIKELPMRRDALDYNGLINMVCENEERNRLIAKEVSELEAPVLVLSERVGHTEVLRSMTQSESLFIKCAVLSSSGTKKEREEKLQGLRSGDITHLFATFQLAKEGLDIPELRTVVFASPVKTETLIVQAAGRVCRKSEGKDHGTLVDFIDWKTGILAGFARKRTKALEKKGLTRR